MWWSGVGFSQTRPIPRSPDGDKTVTLVRALTLGLVVPLTMFDYMSNEQLQTLAEMGRYCHLTFKWAYAKIAKSKCHGHIITKKLISSKLSMGLIPKI